MDKNMRAAKALSLNKNDNKQDSKIDVNHSMVKPALEIMSEAFLEIMQLYSYKSIRTLEFVNVEHGEEMTKKFYDIMGGINVDFVNSCLENLVKRSGTLSDSLVKSAQEYESYVDLMLVTIEKIRIDTEYFPSFLKSLRSVSESMTNTDPVISKHLFSHFMLSPLVKIIQKSPEKLSILVTLLYSSSHSSFQNRLHLAREVFEASQDHCILIKVISELVEYDLAFNKDLHEYYRFYALLGLESSSPRVQASAISTLGSLAALNPSFILEVSSKLENLLKATWWETRAQLLRLAGILLPHKSKHQDLMDNIIKLNFKPTSSKNIIRIGLIYLAPCLNSNPELCDLYIDCLIQIEPKIRETILDTKNSVKGTVVKGYFTQKYLLSGAPAVWNAFGVASSLSKYISEKGSESLEYCHVEILWACLYKPPDNLKWVSVYNELKNYLFKGLEDTEICRSVIEVLKHFMTAPKLMTEILEKSFNTMIDELSCLLRKTSDKEILAHTYDSLRACTGALGIRSCRTLFTGS